MLIDELGGRDGLPYALVKLTSDKFDHVWLPLNRDYRRPEDPAHWQDYQQHIDQALVFERDPRLFEGVWSSVVGDICYLYDKGSDPAADYRARLEALLGERGWFYGHAPGSPGSPALPPTLN